MKNQIKSVPLEKLKAHRDNPNEMSESNLRKLVANIERTGMYEPLIVRVHPEIKDNYELINGHHRYKALKQLGHETADVIVWDVDDQQVNILLMTLNRLQGSDQLGKKLELLKKLKSKMKSSELGRLLPQSQVQIDKLAGLEGSLPLMKSAKIGLAEPIVFFLDKKQKQTVEKALEICQNSSEQKSKAAGRAKAISKIAADFIKFSK